MSEDPTQYAPKPRRLHIGAGKLYLPPSDGWTNHDLFSSVNADVYADMTALPFVPNTFDLVYASHVLEHCHRHCILATLSHWRDILKPGGTLRLAVPDFGAVVKHYTRHGDLKVLMGLLYGGQTHPKNVHTVTFDETTLACDLIRVGFTNIRKWDWRLTDHAQYDDYSQAYLPSMDKENGLHVSLNMEATKP